MESKQLTGSQKFFSCAFRSEEKQLFTIKSCCSFQQKEGFYCHKKDIKMLTISICEACEEYKHKESP